MNDEGAGPERSEEEKAARDAEPNGDGGGSIADRAAEEEIAAEAEQTTLDLPGMPKTLAQIMGRKPTSTKVALRNGGVRSDGLIEPLKEVCLVVPAMLVGYNGPKPVIENDQVVRWEVVSDVRPLEVLSAKQAWPRLVSELERAYPENDLVKRQLGKLSDALAAADANESGDTVAA